MAVSAQNSASPQQWSDEEFCKNYAEARSISKTEVHYGWLAEGENSLQLLDDVNLKGANVIDLGCGMGENLIALSQKGANCFGVDISPYMLEYATRNIRDSKALTIQLERQDMREFVAFPRVVFDLALSIYSLEYLRSLQELRELTANVFARLRPGGAFVFCFSHPLQHHRHSTLANRSAFEGEGAADPLIYSFRDVVGVLTDAGFTVERIIEQHTKTPSKITHEIGKKFPYNFSFNSNPCLADFDAISNKAPHTVIYKCIRPQILEPREQQKILIFGPEKVLIWGQNRSIKSQAVIQVQEGHYEILNVARRDALVAICKVVSFEVKSDDLRDVGNVKIPAFRYGSRGETIINSASLLSMSCKRLLEKGLTPICQTQNTTGGLNDSSSEATYIQRIDPLYGELNGLFPRQNMGILIFHNGMEPSAGNVGADRVFPRIGDRVEIMYIITDWGWEWRRQQQQNPQMDLFG